MIHLLWLSLAVPIVVHLVHRRKARLVPFSTLRFLQMVDQRVARRQRLKELLLLALRLVLLTTVIGALYRPMVRSAAFGGDVPTAVAILLDNTYSMRAEQGGISCFARARKAALDVLDGLRVGDAAVLVPFDSPGQAQELSTALDRLRQQARATQCGYGTATLAAPLRLALLSLNKSPLPRKELYIITDFQRLCWTPALKELAGSFPKDLAVFLVDVGTDTAANLAVADAGFGLNVQVAGAAGELYCRLRNTGRRNVHGRLTLYLAGTRADARAVSLAPGAELTTTFTHLFTAPGVLGGAVRLESDELDADNARYFTADVLDRLPVLLVNGTPSSVPYLNETFFAELALSAPPGSGRRISPVEPKTVAADQFLKQRLDDYACVILANVPTIPELWADSLRRYVLGGGGLIIFAGDRLDASSYNAALGGPGEKGLLPAPLNAVRAADAGGWPITGVQREHPILRGIADALDTQAARVRRLFTLKQRGEDAAGTVLMRTQGGPLLVEGKAGAGTVLLFTSSLDMDWNNLAARSFYLPLLHQMVYYAGRSGGNAMHVTVGMPCVIPLPAAQDPIEVKVYGPEDPSEPIEAQEGQKEPEPAAVPTGSDGRAVFDQTGRPGLYRAVYSVDGRRHSVSFAVNVDARESQLYRIDPREARGMLGVPGARVIERPRRLAAVVRRAREGLPLWDYLFATAILIAVAESLVGNVLLRH